MLEKVAVVALEARLQVGATHAPLMRLGTLVQGLVKLQPGLCSVAQGKC